MHKTWLVTRHEFAVTVGRLSFRLFTVAVPLIVALALIGFAVFRAVAGTYDRILGARLRNEGVSLPQWRILIRLYLAERNDQPTLSPTDLAHSQCVSKNTISAHLRALEDSRLIERQLDPSDLRAFRIRLTPDSRSLIRASTPLHFEFLNDLVGKLSTQESEMLQGLLAKLLESLQRERRGNAAS